MAEADPKRTKPKDPSSPSPSSDIMGTVVGVIFGNLSSPAGTNDSQTAKEVSEMVNWMNPELSKALQNLSPQTLDKVIKETADRLFPQADFLAIATQNVEAASEAVQEALKAVLESLGEAASNIS